MSLTRAVQPGSARTPGSLATAAASPLGQLGSCRLDRVIPDFLTETEARTTEKGTS